jgi:peroxiredoxin
LLCLLVKLTRSRIIVIAAVLSAAVAAAAWRVARVREPAPAVSYTLLDGSKSSTEAQRGKVLLVNFWATSCVSCVAEMPQIVTTHQKFKARGYETVAVAMDYDQPAAVAHFARSRALPFGVAFDKTGEVARAFGDVKLTPTTFLIDKQGRVVTRYLGAPDFVALERLIGELLAER